MISAFGGAFWTGFLRPITSFDEFGFLLALSIWSTFNEPYARLWVLGVISGVPATTAVALWSSGRQLSAPPIMAALMIVTGRGRCPLENSRRDSGRFRRDWSLVHRHGGCAIRRRHVAWRIHSRRLTQSGDAIGLFSKSLGAFEGGMERYCLQSGCDLDRGDRHDDMDFRALAGAFPDAAPLECLPARGPNDERALTHRLGSL
jgi:hypothetical protein